MPPRERLRSRNEGLGVTVNLPYGRTPTPIQSGGPGGEFGGTQRLYTGRNPFMTPNDPGMDFGAPRRRQGGGRPAAPFDDSRRERAIMNQYPRPSNIGPNIGPNIGRDRMGGGIGGLQAAVDPSDWRTIIKILEAGGDPGTETQVAEMGGYGYNPAPKSYDDIYEGLDIIDMEVLPGEGYGPSDEYDYDRKRGYPGYIYDSPPSYAARGGLMSLRR